MIDISSWLLSFLAALDRSFGERVFFVGLQGSYARGEATESSDIDTVVILDELAAADIADYNALLDTLPHRELICGFLSGKREIFSWDSADLFQFYYDTVPVKGSLDGLLALIDSGSVNRAIKTGVGNIYHGCVHNMLYEKSEDILRALYKSASFVLLALCFSETGVYVRSQRELRGMLSAENREISEIFVSLKNGGDVRFDTMSETLFRWAKDLMSK